MTVVNYNNDSSKIPKLQLSMVNVTFNKYQSGSCQLLKWQLTVAKVTVANKLDNTYQMTVVSN